MIFLNVKLLEKINLNIVKQIKKETQAIVIVFMHDGGNKINKINKKVNAPL